MGRLSVIKILRANWPATVLAIAGFVCLAIAGSAWWRYQEFQARHPPIHRTAQSEYSPVDFGAEPKPRLWEAIGRISVPRLHLFTVIVEGVDEKALGLGVGHMPGSAPLGGNGNIVLAGHRDTAFWPLRNIRKGDRIQLAADKKVTYAVESLTVVDPSNVALLRPTSTPVLTVVTCFPFRHVGPAPKRLIIRAAPVQPRALVSESRR